MNWPPWGANIKYAPGFAGGKLTMSSPMSIDSYFTMNSQGSLDFFITHGKVEKYV